MNKLHLVNSRDNIIFDFFNNQIFNEIEYHYNLLVNQLLNLGVGYNSLKKCLIPDNNGDIAFIFNSSLVPSNNYSDYILNLLMPFLLDNNFSYLHGDYAFYSSALEIEKDMLFELKVSIYEQYSFLSNYYIYVVYISNIGLKKAIEIDKYLKRNEFSYNRFADLNMNSKFKSFLSFILVSSFLKKDNVIIQQGESLNFETNKEVTPFDKYAFNVINVPSFYYEIFLSYKISSLFGTCLEDLKYMLKSFNRNLLDDFFDNYKIVIEDSKINYLYKEKKLYYL